MGRPAPDRRRSKSPTSRSGGGSTPRAQHAKAQYAQPHGAIRLRWKCARRAILAPQISAEHRHACQMRTIGAVVSRAQHRSGRSGRSRSSGCQRRQQLRGKVEGRMFGPTGPLQTIISPIDEAGIQSNLSGLSPEPSHGSSNRGSRSRRKGERYPRSSTAVCLHMLDIHKLSPTAIPRASATRRNSFAPCSSNFSTASRTKGKTRGRARSSGWSLECSSSFHRAKPPVPPTVRRSFPVLHPRQAHPRHCPQGD